MRAVVDLDIGISLTTVGPDSEADHRHKVLIEEDEFAQVSTTAVSSK